MTTSLYLHNFKKNINLIVFDKNFDPDSQETKNRLKNIFDKFKEQTKQLSYGEKLLVEGEAFFNRINNNLHEISKFSKKPLHQFESKGLDRSHSCGPQSVFHK